MKIITPVTITDAMLVSSSLVEADEAPWNAGTSYAEGVRCMRTSLHTIYQRAVAGTTPTAPEDDPDNWLVVGPTNRWKMFDRATGTLSEAESSINFTIAPGLVRALALLDVNANSVTVTMTVGASIVYARTISLNTGFGVSNWDDYFFGEIVLKRTVVLTDLPPYAAGRITVTINGVGTVAVGTVVAGSLFDVGGTRPNMGLGIKDYSKKETDQFGRTDVVRRNHAKRMTVPVVLENDRLDWVAEKLTQLRATPVVWLGTSRFDQSIVYGYYNDWSIDVPYATKSYCSVQIEGLT